MSRSVVLGIVAALSFVPAGCRSVSEGPSPEKKVVLWNGTDFAGWHRFIGDPAVDVNDVWRIRNGLLYCGGQVNGYIRTEKPYRNYQLHVEWRWPLEAGNSGVLVHGSGPDKVWPVCIECQLKAGSAGDFVLMNGAGLTVDGADHRDPARQFVAIPKKSPTAEKPAGQWNSYDITCRQGSIRCLVNGVLQNEGTAATPDSGWIALQSEGRPIEFRNIYLLPVQ